MALQAEQIHVTELQHVRIGSAVDHVARFASIHFYRRVFEDKGSLLVRVAGEADRILRRRIANLLRPHCSVHVVTIAALDQSFIHAMTEGHGKLGFLIEMAAVAKRRLRLDQQKFLRFGVMGRMARNATDIIFGMFGVDGVHVLRATRVAS